VWDQANRRRGSSSRRKKYPLQTPTGEWNGFGGLRKYSRQPPASPIGRVTLFFASNLVVFNLPRKTGFAKALLDANKTFARSPLIYRKPTKLASRRTGIDVPIECSGPTRPNTESSGSLVREKRRPAEVGNLWRPLGTRTGEVIRQAPRRRKAKGQYCSIGGLIADKSREMGRRRKNGLPPRIACFGSGLRERESRTCRIKRIY